MTTTDNGKVPAHDDTLPWLSWLEEDIKESVDEGYDTEMRSALKDFLLPKSDVSAADTAKRVDASYQEVVLASDPLLKFTEDRGISGYLNSLWETVFEISLRLPYNGPEQDKLIAFILELRNLPPKGSECYVYTKEPVFFSVMNAVWNHNYVDEDPKEWTEHLLKVRQERCDWWVNFSAFLARITAADLDTNYPERIDYPSRDLVIALEETKTPGMKLDCLILAAAQYILLAADVLYDDFIGGPAKRDEDKKWGVEKWPIWTRRFAEAAAEYKESGKTGLAAVTKKAAEIMATYKV